ncbi:MAG: zinc ribbon domain-containing protein [Anaerolineae bacterium]|nr:zinc ribbon domain-containing protein [Anaerolineae bacterium]
MIIFGTKVRGRKTGEGDFYCPRCQATRRYHYKEARQFFTLYFIPVIPLRRMGEYVECQTCKTAFEPQARLQRTRPAPAPSLPDDLVMMINSAKTRLERGYPVEYMVRDLTAAGLERSAAHGVVAGAIGAGRKVCKACGLTYALSVYTCSECGKPL